MKCAALKTTPQSRWYDLRFIPLIQLLNKMSSQNEIQLDRVIIPLFDKMNFIIDRFEYGKELYMLFIDSSDGLCQCFHLEKLRSDLDMIFPSEIVISSDDDPRQELYMTSVSLVLNAHGYQDLKNRITLLKPYKSLII